MVSPSQGIGGEGGDKQCLVSIRIRDERFGPIHEHMEVMSLHDACRRVLGRDDAGVGAEASGDLMYVDPSHVDAGPVRVASVTIAPEDQVVCTAVSVETGTYVVAIMQSQGFSDRTPLSYVSWYSHETLEDAVRQAYRVVAHDPLLVCVTIIQPAGNTPFVTGGGGATERRAQEARGEMQRIEAEYTTLAQQINELCLLHEQRSRRRRPNAPAFPWMKWT